VVDVDQQRPMSGGGAGSLQRRQHIVEPHHRSGRHQPEQRVPGLGGMAAARTSWSRSPPTAARRSRRR
jgi:hypothetical protein